jgi:hypothetical protein
MFRVRYRTGLRSALFRKEPRCSECSDNKKKLRRYSEFSYNKKKLRRVRAELQKNGTERFFEARSNF